MGIHIIHALCVYVYCNPSTIVAELSIRRLTSSLSISSCQHSLDKVTWAVPGLPATTPMVEDDPAALNTPGATCGITMTTGHNYGEWFISCVYHVYLVEFM